RRPLRPCPPFRPAPGAEEPRHFACAVTRRPFGSWLRLVFSLIVPSSFPGAVVTHLTVRMKQCLGASTSLVTVNAGLSDSSDSIAGGVSPGQKKRSVLVVST